MLYVREISDVRKDALENAIKFLLLFKVGSRCVDFLDVFSLRVAVRRSLAETRLKTTVVLTDAWTIVIKPHVTSLSQ